MWAVVLTSTVPMNTEFDPRWLQKYAHVDTCTHNQAHARMYTHTMARTYNTGMHIYMCAVVHVHINDVYADVHAHTQAFSHLQACI